MTTQINNINKNCKIKQNKNIRSNKINFQTMTVIYNLIINKFQLYNNKQINKNKKYNSQNKKYNKNKNKMYYQQHK